MTHSIVTRLRFARNEFVRCLEGVSEEDAIKRLLPMNCISWMVGHLASQEQFYFEFFSKGTVTHPYLTQLVGFGRPASTPPFSEMWKVWHDITAAVDPFLDTITEDMFKTHIIQKNGSKENGYEAAIFGTPSKRALETGEVRSRENIGTMLLRTTYHYFFHTGEAHAVRQQLGHPDLPFFVRGDMPDLF